MRQVGVKQNDKKQTQIIFYLVQHITFLMKHPVYYSICILFMLNIHGVLYERF